MPTSITQTTREGSLTWQCYILTPIPLLVLAWPSCSPYLSVPSILRTAIEPETPLSLSLHLPACLDSVISEDIWATSPPCVIEPADPDSLPPKWAMWRVAYFLHSPTRGNKAVRKKVKDTATGAARSEARDELIIYQKERLHLTVGICLTTTSLKLFSFSFSLSLCFSVFLAFF